MPRYSICALASAESDLASIAEPTLGQLISAISGLAANPRPNGAIKLAGYRNLYRVRVGQYRVVYEIQDKALVVLVVAVGNRAMIYGMVKRRMG